LFEIKPIGNDAPEFVPTDWLRNAEQSGRPPFSDPDQDPQPNRVAGTSPKV